MNHFAENIQQRLERVPMLKALVPLVVGILIADGVALPLWGVAIGFVVCAVMAVVLRQRAVAEVYIVVAIMLAGAMALGVRQHFSTTPDTRTRMEIIVDKITSKRERATMADARLVAYNAEKCTIKSSAEVRIAAAAEVEIKEGERLLVDAKIMPFDEDYYGRYMAARGVAGEVYIAPENIVRRRSDGGVGKWLRERAIDRIKRLNLKPENEAIALAMSVAERSGITPTLRQAYTRGGAAHLLAVSGLHVGFICVMANLLLAWVAILRHGQIVRSAVVVTVIWIFAAMAGFTPSIVRAAVMFSILQLSLQLASRTDALNTLCLTAFMMLAWDARMLRDAGFLLSFVAVAAIIEWGVPLFPQRRRGLTAWAWRWLASGIATSAVAAVATLPLTAYLFGEVSLWSVVTGTIMVALAAVTVGAAMLWILFPIGAFQGVATHIIGGVTEAMNTIAAWSDKVGVLAAEVRIDGWLCVAIYAIMVVATIIVWGTRRRI